MIGHDFPPLVIRGRHLLPVVQGGMGVGVSANRLAGATAAANAIGTISALDLPNLAADFPDVALIPILSDARGIALVVRKWQKKGRLPDAIIIEHPRHAGGHLGATRPSSRYWPARRATTSSSS